MKFQRFNVKGPILISPTAHKDARGFFMESYRQSWMDDLDLPLSFKQENHARSTQKGVVRGLHFQFGDAPQAKLIRVVKGAILDVAVDIRHGSPTFGKHIAVELSDQNFLQLLVPHGFAHGYCTLTDETEVMYKVDNYYAPDIEAGILWNDLALKIDWPIQEKDAVLSDKDQKLPHLKACPKYFSYCEDTAPFQTKSHHPESKN